MDPFNLTGGPFLQLYGVLFVLTIVAGLVIPRWLRPEGGSPHGVDADQLAWLAGGSARYGDTVVSRLLTSGALQMAGTDEFRPQARDAGRTPAERSVLALPAPSRWKDVTRALTPYSEPIRERLVTNGLLMESGTVWAMRFWQTTPYLLLLVFGAVKWDIGVERGRPVGFLTLFLVVTAIFALIRFATVDRKTRAGQEALATARSNSDRLKRAPTVSETDMAVALFGTVVLAGSGWEDFHRLRTPSSDGSTSSSDSGGSGCGGGGGGGGGCGGCGS
jgi:uncharacterized protein (TIGR04222 family)